MKKLLLSLLLIAAFGLVFQSCRKDNTEKEPSTPEKFVDLRVSRSFNFESFQNVQTAIQLTNNKATGTEIIRVYDAHPNKGGHLVSTGAPNAQGEFTVPFRIASRLDEVYLARLTASGINEYVSVPLNGNRLEYSFMATKDAQVVVDPYCDCDDDDVLPHNFNGNLEIPNGETRCVPYGNHATIKKLRLGSGATLKVCGTALIKKYTGNSSGGKLLVSPDGVVNLPKFKVDYDIENFGTVNISGKGSAQLDGQILNWGTMTATIKLANMGDFVNNGTFTSDEDFEVNPSGSLVNNCKFFITDGGEFKQSGYLENNGYIYIRDEAHFTGNGNNKTVLGHGSLIKTDEFKINGDIEGPESGFAQIKANDEGEVTGGSFLSNFDLCADDEDFNNNATYTNMTFCDINVPIPDCGVFEAPEITSSLQIGGLLNEAITPYTITATGTEPITYAVGNLPSGLSFNANSGVISGTPSVSGTFDVEITASNVFGEDVETLQITIAEPIDPPVITSVLTRSATVNEAFNYTLTATGTGPIAYAVTNLPDGLTFDSETQQISGSATTAGVYNIGLLASNDGGTSNKTLVLTVGTPPTITSQLTASGTAGDQFSTYTFTASGSPNITYQVSNLPQGLTFDAGNRKINGTPSFAGVTNVLLTATNTYGTDVQTLVITIEEGLEPPTITSALTANATVNFPFNYTITADGSQPMSYTASNLPIGLSISGNSISGIPTVAGEYDISITASNAAGSDTKTLVLTITGGGAGDTDGDTVPDNLDDYPDDPTRAFDSYYPNQVDFVSVAFEDLWPAYGDYDFNDFVVNLNYQTVTNAQNNVVDVIVKYQIMADGASLDNGFGIVFDADPAAIESVTGYIVMGNAIVYDAKGFEAGHTDETVVILIDNINPIMEGGMANTIPNGKYVQTTVNTVTTHFSTPQSAIGTPPYNPFIFVNQERGHEVHLKGHKPTEFVDEELFGTVDDDSDMATESYYMSATGLPWGIETPINFDYPIESADILTAHLKFAAWAQSSGVEFQDWYMDKSGYRNDANIYVIP